MVKLKPAVVQAVLQTDDQDRLSLGRLQKGRPLVWAARKERLASAIFTVRHVVSYFSVLLAPPIIHTAVVEPAFLPLPSRCRAVQTVHALATHFLVLILRSIRRK